VADVIRHERDGLLVGCGDVDGLAEALACLVQNADLRRRFRNAGRDRLAGEFRWDEKLDMVRGVYEQRARSASEAVTR
jgi:glycosyltransferase involved in cell wall biosynthesis